MLNDLHFMPVNSADLTYLMHEHGINMRHLSHMAVLTDIPHVVELCVTEMLGRTLK